MLFYFRICAPNIKWKGYTLIELLVTFSLLSLLALSAWPALSFLKTHHEAKRLKIETIQALTQAKLAALTAGRRVTLCLSEDGVHCSAIHANYWLSFWDERGAGVMSDSAFKIAQFPISSLRMQIVVKGMSQMPGAILFSPETVGNARVTAYLSSQNRVLWALAISRLGRIRELTV